MPGYLQLFLSGPYYNLFDSFRVIKTTLSSSFNISGLFPPVTIFLDLFLCAGYFFNAFD